MQDELTLLLAKRGEVPRGLAFQAARRLGLPEFQWKDPKTGKVGRYHTRMAGEGMKLPRGMKESDLYRNPAQERINKEYYDTTQQIERDYQQKLAGIKADTELGRLAEQEASEQKAEAEGLAEYLRESGEASDRAKIGQLLRKRADEDLDRLSYREDLEQIAEMAGELPVAYQNYVDRQKLQAAMPIHMASDRAKMGEMKRREDLAFRDWAAQKQQEQALESVYPEAFLGGLGFLRGLFGARRAAPMVRREPTMRDADMMYYQGRPEPSFAGGGLASLAAQGRGGDSMLVHMSPDEVMNLQQMARMRGQTMTINPETGLPEAFSLRKLLRGLASIAPIAAAFFPPLAAALPALATPLGAGISGAIAGGLSGEKGFDLKRGLTGGLLSYGLSSAMQGLKAAGGVGEAAAAGAPAGEFTAAEIAKMSPQAQAAIAGAPANYASLATPVIDPTVMTPQSAASTLGAQEAGIAGLKGVAGAPVVAPSAPMGSASQGLGNLLSSDAATRAAAQQAFTGEFGRGALMATGAGALGTMALDEQEKFAKQALAEGKIAQAEYDAMMARINAARANAERAMQANPYRLYAAGGDVGDDQEDPMFNPVSFRRGGIGSLPPRYVDGKGDGMSDSVPAVISGRQPARLADGEFVIPADVVSHLGNGSSKAGAKQLYSMMDRVRKARTGNPRQGKAINASRMMPA